MKKVFLAILATIAVVGMVSCNKDDNGKGGKKGGKTAAEVNIKIDGDFADWAALTDVASAVNDADAAYPNLLSLKAAGDKSNIFVYFEYEIPEAEVQGTGASLTIHLNSDNDGTTGGAYWMWAGNENEPAMIDDVPTVIPGIDYYLVSENGFLTSDLANFQEMGDMSIEQFVGTVGMDLWDEGATQTKEVTSFCESKGKVSAGIAIVELSIARSAVNCTRAGNIRIGLVVQQNIAPWAATGVIPGGASAGAVEMLEVALP